MTRLENRPPDPVAVRIPGAAPTSWWPVAVVVLGLASLHAILVWGHVLQFWGDTGRWMHEVDRFAQGERLYLDFTWPFPPLAMWIVGSLARWTGTGVHALWGITAGIYLVMAGFFLTYLRLVVPRDLAMAVGIASVLGAMAFAQPGGAPLPLGSYTPAALVGGTFLLAAAACLVAVVQGHPSRLLAAGLGMAASLAVLTKQDFWVPAFLAVVAGVWLGTARQRPILLAAAILPALLGYLVVLDQLGLRDTMAMLGGFGHVSERGGRGLPSVRLLFAEVGALSAALALGFGMLRPAGRRTWAVLLGVGAIVVSGYLVQEGRTGLLLVLEDMGRRSLSLFLPLVVFAWLWRSAARGEPGPRRLAMVLLLVAIGARSRRGFEGLEWFHVLLELPAYALAVRAMIGTERIAWQRAWTWILVVGGLGAYWLLGRGPLTARERAGHETVVTTRGAVFMGRNAAGDYRFAAKLVDSLDPGRRRSVFAFGFSGGWNYWLSRANPTPAPQGFWYTREPAEAVLAAAVAAQPIVIDSRIFAQGSVRDFRAGVLRWNAPLVPSVYMQFDRPYFERLVSGCPEVGRHPAGANPFLRIHDCALRMAAPGEAASPATPPESTPDPR